MEAETDARWDIIKKEKLHKSAESWRRLALKVFSDKYIVPQFMSFEVFSILAVAASHEFETYRMLPKLFNNDIHYKEEILQIVFKLEKYYRDFITVNYNKILNGERIVDFPDVEERLMNEFFDTF